MDLFYDLNVEDLLFLSVCQLGGDKMCQRGERVMVTLLNVERLTLSRCAEADVQEKTWHCLSKVRKQWMQSMLDKATNSALFLLFFLIYETSIAQNRMGGGSGGGKKSESWDETLERGIEDRCAGGAKPVSSVQLDKNFANNGIR